MAWTKTTRAKHCREALRYASDLTNAEWRVLAPMLKPRRLGRPWAHSRRAMVNAMYYICATGCQWRALPRGFPPRSTVQACFYRWRDNGTWQVINRQLVGRARQAEGRSAAPSAGVIDSQSVKTTESGGPRGRDAAKRIQGRKRHIVTDTQGFLLAVLVHPASIQDCHGAVPLLTQLRRSHPNLRHIYADRVYRGPQLRAALAPCGPWNIEIVQRPHGVKGFQLLPRRWVIERTFAWLGRNRRLAKDFERTVESATAWIFVSSIRALTRRLARL